MIAVLGSINMDLVLRVPRFPNPGETISSTEVATYSGGKGANQAVAAARLGADVQRCEITKSTLMRSNVNRIVHPG